MDKRDATNKARCIDALERHWAKAIGTFSAGELLYGVIDRAAGHLHVKQADRMRKGVIEHLRRRAAAASR